MRAARMVARTRRSRPRGLPEPCAGTTGALHIDASVAPARLDASGRRVAEQTGPQSRHLARRREIARILPDHQGEPVEPVTIDDDGTVVRRRQYRWPVTAAARRNATLRRPC